MKKNTRKLGNKSRKLNENIGEMYKIGEIHFSHEIGMKCMNSAKIEGNLQIYKFRINEWLKLKFFDWTALFLAVSPFH